MLYVCNEVAYKLLWSHVHVYFVGCNAFFLRLPDLVKCAGNICLYLLNGMVLTSAPGSTLTIY